MTDHLSVKYFNSVFRAISDLAATTSAISTRAVPLDSGAGGVVEPKAEAGELDIETGHILLAILSPDSTVVYYKLAKGLVKPVN